MKITAADYVKRMVPFLNGLAAACREPYQGLQYYGTGESAHWAVQCNQQMMGALGILADVPDLKKYHLVMTSAEIRERALAMFRYSMRTHLTGDLVCTDGKQWGKHWISVLGLERATPGLNALEPYFTEEDAERYRKCRIFESDYRLNEYPIRACMDGRKGPNVPESNIWNAGFLMRTALDYPDLPQAEAYLKKATAMMLNGISIPKDAVSKKRFNGKPLSELYVGPNFTENYSLDHHGYMNVGYSFICLSNIALLYFNFKERGQTMPPELLHHVQDLWNTVKNFIFPDGRLLRIGGDSRSRYNYCQCFAISSWILAAELFHDEDAIRFEKGFLALMEKEQSENPDGSFYGKRLSELKDYSYFYYRRLEADPMHALSTGAYWRRKFDIFDSAPAKKPQDGFWSDEFHGAELLRTGNTIRSVVRRAEDSQEVLCLPLNRSDMAEWMLNLTGYVGCHFRTEEGDDVRHEFKDGFLYTRKTAVTEKAPMGEGEEIYHIADREYSCAAIPDGKTMLIYERLKMVKETTLTFGYRSLHCQIPNDVYNDYKRVWTPAKGKSFETRNLHGTNDLLNTKSDKLNCDDAISFFSICGGPIQIKRSAKQNVFLQCGLWSMYADEVCLKSTLKPYRAGENEILYETVCAVCADTPAKAMLAHPNGSMKTLENGLKLICFTGFDGKDYRFAVNFTEKTLTYGKKRIASADAALFCGDVPCGK